jgi:hypothetical protein
MRKNKSKVCLVKSSFDQHFPSTSHDCVAVPFLVRPFFWLLNKIKVSLNQTGSVVTIVFEFVREKNADLSKFHVLVNKIWTKM